MGMSDGLRNAPMRPLTILAALLLGCVALEYYLHLGPGTSEVYPHLFYIPIVVAALYWGVKGALPVALFLGTIHTFSSLRSDDSTALWRSLILILLGTAVGAISEWRKGAEKALHQSEQKYRDLVEWTGVGILVNDSDGNLVYFNEAFAELFGYPVEELRKLTFDALVHPDFSQEGLAVYTSLRQRQERTSHHEFTGIKKDGSIVFLEVDVVALQEGNGSKRWRSYARDITDRKRVEEALEEARQKEVSQQIQLMHADRLTTVGRLAAGVAHEINNPLAVLYGTIQRIKNGSILADVVDREAVDRMLRVSRRIKDIVSHFLTFARQKTTEKTPYDINKLLVETLTLVSSHLVKSGIKHTLKLSESVPVVCVDQQQMQQVFLNLVFNALDAMPDGGELTIATEITGDQIAISFQDTGCGISQENLGRLFVPFFTTKEVGEGTGLGLSISHEIVQAHEGKIDVKCTPGHGARFDIFLPIDGVNPRG